MEGDGAQSPSAVVNGLKADSTHEGGEFWRAEEPSDGLWEIFVSDLIARDKAANPRQYITKIPPIEVAQAAFWGLGKFQNRDGATGLQYALNLSQA